MWTWFVVTPGLLRHAAARFATLSRTTFLRASDAIHLACAAEHGFAEVYSSDAYLLAAALRFGLAGRNVIRTTPTRQE